MALIIEIALGIVLGSLALRYLPQLLALALIAGGGFVALIVFVVGLEWLGPAAIWATLGVLGVGAIAACNCSAVELAPCVVATIRPRLAGFVCALVGAGALDAGTSCLSCSPATFFAGDVMDRLGGAGTQSGTRRKILSRQSHLYLDMTQSLNGSIIYRTGH